MIRIIYLCLVLSLPFSVLGQMSNIFNRLSNADGLNTNRVNCIWQDKKGFLWVGTENGVQRFDGRKFISFKSDGLDHSMPPLGIDQILDAGDGKIWLRQGSLIGKFDPISFTYSRVPVKSPDQLLFQSEFNLFRDSKGNIFLCTHKSGLLCYNPTENKFTDDHLPIKVPDGWTVNSLFEDTITGDYWICSDFGLAVYQSKTQTLVYKRNNPLHLPVFQNNNFSSVYAFFIDTRRTWWIICWDFRAEVEPVLIHFDPLKNQMLEDISTIQTSGTDYEGTFWINETRNGQIWFGGVNTLVCYDTKSNAFIQNKKAVPGEYDIKCKEIKQTYEDRENNIWLTTDNGLYVVTSGQKSVYNAVFNDMEHGKDMVVTSIQETKDLENWIGTLGNGILLYDKYFKRIDDDLYKSMKGDNLMDYKQVWDMSQHSKSGLIWSGCQNGLIAIFDPQAKKPVHLLEPPVFEQAPVRQILEDKDGSLFFGTQKGRLAKWKYGTKMTSENFEIIRDFNSSIYILFKDKSDRIWVGTRNTGLFIMDHTGQNVLYHFSGQPGSATSFMGNCVYDIEQYNDSIFFVSTGFLNLINLKSAKVQTLTQYDGLPGANVTQLLKDKENILWFINNNGLGSYNYPKNIFASYNDKNGVIMAEKSPYAKFEMRNGELWFGGENSLFGFVPEELKRNTAAPEVTLTDFKIFNKYIPLDSLMASKKVILKPEQNSFTFYFSSLSYTHQDKLIYYYKLDGVDADWVKAEQDMAANYTTLSPGKYMFNVKCINMQGMESAHITSLPLTILPHFYQTWWFALLGFVLLGWLTYLIYRLRLTKLLAIERVRNKVARDLHDDIGSTLSTINILSSMAKSKMHTDPVKTSSYLSKITDNSQQMMEAMDDIVWSIKPDNDSMLKILARMREYASGILEPKDVEITFNIGEHIQELKLDMETRRDVFLIFKEAVNNVAKYAHCTTTIIELAHSNQRLTMSITDNGVGFNVNLADGGNGLGNMQKRAESLKGTIDISSWQGLGTEVFLNIPVQA